MPWVHNTSPGISGSTTRALGPSISEPVRLLLRSAPPVCSVKLRRESKTRWSAGHQPGHQRLLCKAQLTVREESTGVEFPEVNTFWIGSGKFRSLGAGVRAKKFAFVPVKVYAVTLYVEADKASRELGIRSRGGFFSESSVDDYAIALNDGAFAKVLQIQLVRKVDGSQFYQALDEALAPRMRITGDTTTLARFGEFFQSKQLDKGTTLVMLWRTEGSLELYVAQPGIHSFAKVSPELRIDSSNLCRALFEVYLGENSIVPDAKAAWAQGAKALLASDATNRGTDKAGAG